MTAFAHPRAEGEGGSVSLGWTFFEEEENPRAVSAACASAPDMGVYRVFVSQKGASSLFGQRRNAIALSNVPEETSFLTCLTEFIPSMSTTVLRDTRLFAAAPGAETLKIEFEPASARRVFVAGDSTVADQSASSPYYPFDSYCGWGQMLSLFLKDDAVCNQAHSGLTARCFCEDGHLEIVKKHLRPGDLLLIQFGHNDQKRRALQPQTGYPAYLRKIAEETRALGALPVLVSPISRVPGRDAGGAFSALSGHAECAKALAKEMGLPFIDLHEFSFELFSSLGEDCRRYFKPGDSTHTNDYGAYLLAETVAKRLKELGLASPDIPLSRFCDASDRALSPCKAAPKPLPVPYADIEGVSDPKVIYDGVQRGLFDPCVRFAHPGDPLPRAQFIQLLFRAAKLSGSPTDGQKPFPDVDAREFDAPYAMACRERGFVTESFYRPDDFVTNREARSLCARAGFPADFPEDGERPTRFEIVRALLRAQ